MLIRIDGLVPDLALILLAVYGIVAVVLRALLQLILTGSVGIKGIGGAPGSAEWLSGLLFLLGVATVVAGPVLGLTGALEPIDTLEGDAGHAIGIVLAGAGMAATAYAQLAMGRAWRIGVDPSERTRLVTGGPFSVVRNPIFSGMIPFFAGVMLLVPSVVTIGGALLMIVAIERQVRFVEEPYLMRVHGRAYTDYAGRVGRFVPGIGRLRR